MRQLEPGACECIGELIRVRQEAPRDFLVRGIEAQREIRRQHRRYQPLRLVVRVRNGRARALRSPLVGAAGALRQFPFVAEQVLEEVDAEASGRRGPRDFQAAGDRIGAFAAAEFVRPAKSLCFEIGGFGLDSDIARRGRAVRLAERVATGDQRDGFFVVHRHAGEGLADVARRGERIGIAVGAFGIDVDQAHLHGRERVFELARVDIAVRVVIGDQHAASFFDTVRAVRIAQVAAEPGSLATPVHVLVGLPHVRASATEAEGFEAHSFQRNVAGQDHQVGPGNPAAVFLLDRPQQPARLVEADVVGPAVERREALLASSAAAAAVTRAIRARAVPRHADEQRPVVAEVRRPPVLRVGHERRQIFLQRGVVQALELRRVVEARAHRIGLGGMLVQQIEPQLIRPPVAVRRAAATRRSAVIERAFGFG